MRKLIFINDLTNIRNPFKETLFLKQCCICKEITKIEFIDYKIHKKQTIISHGYCKTCFDKEYGEI